MQDLNDCVLDSDDDGQSGSDGDDNVPSLGPPEPVPLTIYHDRVAEVPHANLLSLHLVSYKAADDLGSGSYRLTHLHINVRA